MINQFKSTLQQFVNKKCQIEEVTSQLEQLLMKHPQLAGPLDEQILQLANKNKIARSDYDTIHKITAGYMSASSADDKTVVNNDDGADVTNVGDDDDVTEVAEHTVAEGTPGGDDDVTAISTEVPPQSSGDGFALDLDATGASPTATTPTVGPDGMPVMTHGSEVIGVGSVLRNRFELKAKLGEGGMGAVFMAIDKIKEEAQDKNPKVAVKVLNETFKQFRESFIALQRESSKQQRLAHPNIATVFDFDRDYTYGTVFMTMEMLEGEPLDKFIRRVPPEGLSYEEARPIIEGMCNGLAYAHHHNLVHSDFKPANTFLNKEGVVKILDFGIARAAKPKEAEDGTKESTLFDPGTLGALTPAYASAEMLEGQTPVPTDDIYALACVTYQLLGGKHPYNKMPANQARDNKLKPAPIKKLKSRQMKGLLRGLAFEREKRTESVEQFLDEITPKKPIALYATIGTIVILSIIGILGRGAVEEHFRVQRNNEMIATIIKAGQENNAAVMKARLDELTRLDDVSKAQIKVEADVQKAILDYYSNRIDQQIDKEKGKYDYPEAFRVLSEARIHYKDSGRLDSKQEEIEARKVEELEQMRDLYTRFLKTGPWLSIDGANNDMPDVIATIKMIEPGHELLTDPRLAGSYIKEAQGARQEKQFDRAASIIKQAKAYAPDETALDNEQDELTHAIFQDETQKKIDALSTTIARAGDGKSLQQVLEVSDELAQMRTLAPDNTLLKTISGNITTALASAFKASKDTDTTARLARQFVSIAPALDTTQQQAVRSELDQAWQRAGGVDTATAEEFSQKAGELTSQIAELSKKSEFTHEWTLSLKQLVAELEALTGPGNAEAQKVRRELALKHMEQAENTSKNKRLAESQIQLAYAKEFDPNAPNLGQTEAMIRDALARQEEERLEKERLATIAALKQDLLAKARSEKVDDAIAFLDLLKVYLLPDDKFLVEDGPNAIGKAYASSALRIKKQGDELTKDYISQRDTYNRALEEVKKGLEIASASPDLASARAQIGYALTVAEVRNTFKTADKLDLAGLRTQLKRMQGFDPAEYKRLQTVFSETVAERIATMENYDPKAAKDFLDAAKQLPINQVLLSRIRITVPEPSKYSKAISEAIKQAQLTEASSLMKKAATEEGDHPEIKRLRSVLASKIDAANTEYKKYQAFLKKGNVEQAKKQLVAALKIWTDSKEYKSAFEGLNKSVVQQYHASQARCETRLAGYGRRKKGRCYDMVSLQDRGPTLVVVPAGGGHSKPFAITKNEISRADFNYFCKSTGKCKENLNNPKLPVTGITLQQAKEYAEWLTKTTGGTYRLPTVEEWKHAASSAGKQPRGKNYNCTLRLGDKVIKGTGLEDVDSGKQNGWGLVNYIGNAQEWTRDGTVMGGAYTDTMQKCSIDLQRPHNGSADEVTSFRLVRDVS